MTKPKREDSTPPLAPPLVVPDAQPELLAPPDEQARVPLPHYPGGDTSLPADPAVTAYTASPESAGLRSRSRRPGLRKPSVIAQFGVILGAVVVISIAILMISGTVVPDVSVPDSSSSSSENEDLGKLPLTPGEYFANPRGNNIEYQLETMLDSYRLASDKGALWDLIPDTEENRVAFQAFLYLNVDMAIAARFGVDDATAREYAEEAAEYERLFLAEEPLGSNVTIDNGERVFTYDGDTGEGGWADS